MTPTPHAPKSKHVFARSTTATFGRAAIAAPVLQKVSDNHVVKNVNKQVQSGMDWVHGLLNPKKPETINAPEQLTRVAGADENGQEVNEEKEAKEAKGKEPAQTADAPAEVAAQTTA